MVNNCLFNNVNSAVATVITYDSGNNKFNQGSGFFIYEDGHFITNYHVVKGAYSVVVQMTALISSGSSGSPVIDMHGKVVGVAFLQIVNGQNLNFAIPGENIVNLKVQQLLNLAAWSERKNTEANNKFEHLRKEIVKHIKSEKPGAKIEKSVEPCLVARF